MRKIEKNNGDRLAEVERSLARMQADREREAKERRKEAEEERRKAAARWAKIEETVARTNKQLGDYTQGEAEALEQEYADAIKKSGCIGDIPVDDAFLNVGKKYEFDLACPNGEIVVVVETKRRFTLGKVRKFAKDRLLRFAESCPALARGRKIIGAIGGGGIPKGVREEAEKLGLLVLTMESRKIIVQSDKGMRAV